MTESKTSNESNKEHLGVVVVGHVDAGKSTTTGRLIYELGGLSDRDMAKLKEIALENNRAGFEWAYVFDKSKEERQRGITIQSTTKQFFTEKYHYSVIDAPGHRDFVKNMISGASQADCAILMVPADKGGFEKSIARGNHKKGEVEGQTRQHARLLHLYGIDKVIVCVNKMDDKIVNYSQKRFEEIKVEIYEMLRKIFGDDKVKSFPIIPISGFNGDNLIKPSSKTTMPWFKGWKVDFVKKKKVIRSVEGETLLDALNDAIKPPKRSNKKALRMPVSATYGIKGIGLIISGRIEQGQLTPGLNVKFYPSGCGGKVLSIQMHHKSVDVAQCGDNVGINIRGVNEKLKPRVGEIMCIEHEESDDQPPLAVQTFTATIYVQDHPGHLKVGFTPLIHIRTGKSPAKMIAIKWKKQTLSGLASEKIESPQYIEKGDEAQVVFQPLTPFVCQPFAVCKPLGRLAGMDQNSLVLLGKVVDVTTK